MTDPPTIFVAMPLFEGWEHVAHTLTTVRQQTYGNFRVLISVDGDDKRSRAACQPFLSDPRFEIVLHPERLGWAGNMNYLASRFAGHYFCYWQHDDYCAPTYLETLLDHAIVHPEAAAIYCDMKIFGERNGILRAPPVTGFALERVLAQVRNPSDAAIRCLIRADALRASLPINDARIWVLPLARAGEFHHVPKLLYFRRMRKEAVTFGWLKEPPQARWRFSMDWALAVLANVHPLIGDDERTDLFSWVVHLLATNGTKSIAKYNLADASHELQVKFVHQLLDEIASSHGYRPWPDIPASELEPVLRARLSGKKNLRDGEALLIEAALAREVLPDEAIVSGHVPLPQSRGGAPRAAGRRTIRRPH